MKGSHNSFTDWKSRTASFLQDAHRVGSWESIRVTGARNGAAVWPRLRGPDDAARGPDCNATDRATRPRLLLIPLGAHRARRGFRAHRERDLAHRDDPRGGR